MNSHALIKTQPDRAETRVWALLTLVVLLAVALAGLSAITPLHSQPAGASPPPAAYQAPIPSDYVQSHMRQFVADLRTLVAALRYLMESETEPTVVA